MTPHDLLLTLRPLVRAEAAAEAVAAGVEPADLEQGALLYLLEHARREGPPAQPAAWVRRAVRAQARPERRRARYEVPYDTAARQPWVPAAGPYTAERREDRAALLALADRLPGRCPDVVRALLSAADPTYREISNELGMSQGSLGPIRSRCLQCLRRMLPMPVPAPEAQVEGALTGQKGGPTHHVGRPSVRADTSGRTPSPSSARAHTTG